MEHWAGGRGGSAGVHGSSQQSWTSGPKVKGGGGTLFSVGPHLLRGGGSVNDTTSAKVNVNQLKCHFVVCDTRISTLDSISLTSTCQY